MSHERTLKDGKKKTKKIVPIKDTNTTRKENTVPSRQGTELGDIQNKKSASQNPKQL